MATNTGETGLRRQVNLDPWVASAVAGVAAGAFGGALARLAMRGVALLMGQAPGFSIEGTLGILTIFAMFGFVVALPWTLVRLLSPWTRRTRALALAAILTALLILPLYGVATGDLQNASTGQVVQLMLLFLPIPFLMGLGIEWVAGGMERRLARAGDHTLPLGWTLGLGALAILSFLSLFGSLMGSLRHPELVASFLGGQTTAFQVVRGNALVMGLLVAIAYLMLALRVFWRRLDRPEARVEFLLLLATPMLLLSGGGTLPLPLAWLPDAPVLLAATRALGVAALLLFMLTAGGLRAPRALWITCSVAWAALALWLLAGGRALPGWTEGAVWGMLALACGYACIERWRQAASGAARWTATALALFAVCWLGLWLAALLVPGLGLRSLSAFEIPLRVTLFWLPWLLLPASLWAAPAPQPVLSPLPATR